MRKFFIVIAASIFLVACGGETKKVLIMASGKLVIAENSVTLEPGTTHTEEEILITGDRLTVKSPDGELNLDIPGGGLYLLNLKKDTLVGSYQRLGTSTDQIKLSRDDLKHRLDSMTMLMQGTNVNEANRNYWIAPMSLQRITGNTQAQLVGPFHNLPRSFDPNKEHEVYKFHTNKQVLEIIEKARPMSESAEVQE